MTTTERALPAPDARTTRAHTVHVSVLWGLGALLLGSTVAVVTTERERAAASGWTGAAAPAAGLAPSTPGRRVVVVRRSRAS